MNLLASWSIELQADRPGSGMTTRVYAVSVIFGRVIRRISGGDVLIDGTSLLFEEVTVN